MAEALNIVCPACGAVNRASQDKLASRATPSCGKCHRELFDGRPAEIASPENFEKMIGRNDIPVVVDFWADWCGPCKMMAPQFASAASAMEPMVRFAKLDTEAVQSVAARYNIRSIPTIILFRNGHEAARQSGAMDANGIRHWIMSQLGA